MSGAARKVELIRPGQRSRLWAAVGQLRKLGPMSKEDAESVMRGICEAVSGQTHSSQLTVMQAGKVCSELEARLAELMPKAAPPAEELREGGGGDSHLRTPWARRGPGPRESQGITQDQSRMICGLFGLLGWDIRQQRGFCERQVKVGWPENMAQADALIEPLKSMVMREVGTKGLLERVTPLIDHPALASDSFLPGFVRDLQKQLTDATSARGGLRGVLTPRKLWKLQEAEGRVAKAAGHQA